jgi:hypothetical protein
MVISSRAGAICYRWLRPDAASGVIWLRDFRWCAARARAQLEESFRYVTAATIVKDLTEIVNKCAYIVDSC